MKNFFLTLVYWCLIFVANAQTVKFSTAKFNKGDDLQWAVENFNDASWKTIKTNELWQKQGLNLSKGFGWMRIAFVLPHSLKTKMQRDKLRLFLAKIDDAGEVYLNGKMIYKTGRFPQDDGGYQSNWNSWTEVHLNSSDPLLKWGKKNIIAIRIYDGDAPGGMWGAIPYIQQMEIADVVKILSDGNSFKIINAYNVPLKGLLKYELVDFYTNQTTSSKSIPVTIPANGDYKSNIVINNKERVLLNTKFIEEGTGKFITANLVPPYILTPKAGPAPAINSAKVFGIRPNSPFLFKIAASGTKPLEYKVENLPEGLILDKATGIITGKLSHRGDYKMKFIVKNGFGSDEQNFTVKVGDLLALTPPMGWNSWNAWGMTVSDEKVRSSAKALIDKSLIDYGWNYINIDEGWQSTQRKPDGELPPNEKFPDIKALADWVHSNGLKFGIYSSPGPKNCGGLPGSYSYEEKDAKMYNSWDVDFLKYDWCQYSHIHKGDTTLYSFTKPYEVMQKFLRDQPRDFVYSLCQYGMRDVWKWGASVDGNLWRTTADMFDNWQSMSTIGFNQNEAAPYAGPGRWNDPDMLVVGNVGWSDNLHPSHLTPDEQYTHVSLWSLLAAPLLIGCDIASLDEFTLNLLTNREVIAINQDELGRSAQRYVRSKDYQIWMKPLQDGSKAIGIFNLSPQIMDITLNWSELGLENGTYIVRDIWRQKELGIFKSFTTKVASHGVTLVVIK